MSTRCHVELHDCYYKGNHGFPRKDKPPVAMPKTVSHFGVRLYHHSDGYPSFMRPKLKRFLPAVFAYLKEAGHPYWWDSERVAAVLIALSIEDYEQPLKPFSTDRPNQYVSGSNGPYRTNGGVPTFQPCFAEHCDIEYVWKVTLGPEQGKFKISHKHVYWCDEQKKLVSGPRRLAS